MSLFELWHVKKDLKLATRSGLGFFQTYVCLKSNTWQQILKMLLVRRPFLLTITNGVILKPNSQNQAKLWFSLQPNVLAKTTHGVISIEMSKGFLWLPLLSLLWETGANGSLSGKGYDLWSTELNLSGSRLWSWLQVCLYTNTWQGVCVCVHACVLVCVRMFVFMSKIVQENLLYIILPFYVTVTNEANKSKSQSM